MKNKIKKIILLFKKKKRIKLKMKNIINKINIYNNRNNNNNKMNIINSLKNNKRKSKYNGKIKNYSQNQLNNKSKLLSVLILLCIHNLIKNIVRNNL